jgi:hypothetical protein
MSTPAQPDRSVNRLHDIVVEEVSLVDRAANKHRFLIVKRSSDMNESTSETAATAADETEDVEDLEIDADDDDDTEDERGAGDSGDDTTEAGDNSPLAVALEALEGLTEAVELLGTATADGSQPRLTDLAGELRAVADRLAGLAGTPAAEEPEEPVDDSPAADSDDSPPTAPDIRIEEQPDQSAALGERLEELAQELRSLAGTLREQQQRLARLEKRSGLPNSARGGEQPKRPEEADDVSWPLDLNRGLDRESVDKALSFHDL